MNKMQEIYLYVIHTYAIINLEKKIKNLFFKRRRGEHKTEVNMKDETVWLNTEQIIELFDRDYKSIRKHINSALKEELEKERFSQNLRIPLFKVLFLIRLKHI